MATGAERPESRSGARLLVGVQAAAATALAFSSAAATEYYARSHAFCAPGSGCDAVRGSQLGQSIGEALPAVGVVGFATVLLCAVSRRPMLQLLGVSFAAAGGVAAALLLALQAWIIGAWCALCVGADVAALVAAACATALLCLAHLPIATGTRMRAIARALVVLGALAPAVFAYSRPVHVPAFVSRLSAPGKLNVIEFSDFECPFCRRMHPVLAAAVAAYGDRVHFVRKSFPLPSHRDARHAARAFVCAAAQGRGEAMADRLFTSSDISAGGCARHAQALGLDAQRFEACVRDPGTDAAIDRDIASIRSSDFHGLPTVWIGNHVIEGFDQDKGGAPYEAALARARHAENRLQRYLPWALLALAVYLALRPALRRG